MLIPLKDMYVMLAILFAISNELHNLQTDSYKVPFRQFKKFIEIFEPDQPWSLEAIVNPMRVQGFLNFSKWRNEAPNTTHNKAKVLSQFYIYLSVRSLIT